MAIAVVGGLVTSTLLSLFYVPVVFAGGMRAATPEPAAHG
jgi:multidrug efflux pump subunit AcrB